MPTPNPAASATPILPIRFHRFALSDLRAWLARIEALPGFVAMPHTAVAAEA